MFRSKGRLSHGMRNKSSSLLTLNEIESLGKSSDWRKNYNIRPKEIGRGHFSKVFHVTCDNRQTSFAAKVIRRRRGGTDRYEKIKQEAALIRQLNDLGVQSVIQLIDIHENFSEVVLITELAKGGSLFTLVQESESGLSPNYVKIVTLKLLLALETMHRENIVHLDIKADNILLREPYPSTDIAICDFGLATQLKIGKSYKDLVGTPDYMAPEVINYEKITVNSDMWSVGVFVYYLLTGISPFMGKSKDETLSNVSKVNISFDTIFSQPEYIVAKDYILSVCIKLPTLRLSSTDSLKHDWFRCVDDTLPVISNINPSNTTDSPNDHYEEEQSTEEIIDCGAEISPIAQRWPSADLNTLDISDSLNRYRSTKCRPFSTASCENIFINDVTDNSNPKLMYVEEVNDELVNDISRTNHNAGICEMNPDLLDSIFVNTDDNQINNYDDEENKDSQSNNIEVDDEINLDDAGTNHNAGIFKMNSDLINDISVSSNDNRINNYDDKDSQSNIPVATVNNIASISLNIEVDDEIKHNDAGILKMNSDLINDISVSANDNRINNYDDKDSQSNIPIATVHNIESISLNFEIEDEVKHNGAGTNHNAGICETNSDWTNGICVSADDNKISNYEDLNNNLPIKSLPSPPSNISCTVHSNESNSLEIEEVCEETLRKNAVTSTINQCYGNVRLGILSSEGTIVRNDSGDDHETITRRHSMPSGSEYINICTVGTDINGAVAGDEERYVGGGSYEDEVNDASWYKLSNMCTLC